MQINIPKNIAIALSSVIICLGLVTFTYAQYSSDKAKEGNSEENKVAETETKTVSPNPSLPFVGTEVSGEISGENLVLNWKPVDHPEFSGYKVVISKNDPNPKYPDDGYLYWITDRNITSAIIDNSEAYKNGDFGEKLTHGEQYYFSITVVYNSKTVPGDTVQLTYPLLTLTPAPPPVPVPQPTKQVEKPAPKPASPTPAPKVSAYADGSKIIVKWKRIESSSLQGYKVVISKHNVNPAYPQDGYLAWITDKSTTQWVVDNTSKYNGGDFDGYLTPGQVYQVSITAVYSTAKVAGNSVKVTYPAAGNKPDDQVNYNPTAISVLPSGADLILQWPAATSSNFTGYKVVISKHNPNPKYPDDGYLEWITDRTVTALTVNAATYYGGDINGKLMPGQTYYFSITTIYDGGTRIAGPAQQGTIPMPS